MRGLAVVFCLAAAALSMSAPAHAQAAPPTPPSVAQRSLAAGYKALFHCNGRYAGALKPDAVERDEIAATYRDYEAAFAATGAPVFDDAGKSVAVSYAPSGKPRLAVWRDHFGCIVVPPNADDRLIADLPRPSKASAWSAAPSPKPWPLGDAAGAGASLTTAQRAALDGVFAKAFAGEYGANTNTTGIVLASPTALLAERYHQDYGPFAASRTWSVAKTLAATLVGVRVSEGKLKLDQRAGLPEWAAAHDPRAVITLTHMLHMASGLDPSPAGNRTDEIYFGGGRIDQFASRATLLSPPGAAFVYANNDTMNAARVLGATFRSRQAYWAWTKATLDKIGMTHTVLGVDWAGDYVLASQVWSTPRDLARMGVVYLNGGKAGDQQILSADWLRFVSAPAPAQPPAANAGAPAQPGYGAQVWLWGGKRGLPDGTFAAQGNRGQFVMIIPARNLVLVRRGGDGPGVAFDMPRFTTDVLAALAE